MNSSHKRTRAGREEFQVLSVNLPHGCAVSRKSVQRREGVGDSSPAGTAAASQKDEERSRQGRLRVATSALPYSRYSRSQIFMRQFFQATFNRGDERKG